MNSHEVVSFSVFIFFILLMLVIDLGVFNRNSHIVYFKEALIWSIVWIGISLLFYIVVVTHGDFIHGISSIKDIQYLVGHFSHPIKIIPDNFEESLRIYKYNLGLEYLTGYLIEKALSVDNIFVMIMIFYAFGVEQKYYHHVLFWGIIGAIVLRFLFIFISSTLIQEFNFMLYLFGLLLIFTGVKMFLSRNKGEKIEPQHHPVVRFASKYFSVYSHQEKGKFVIYKNKKFYIMPLFIVLMVIEFSDVLFAVDSIPAIFAVTKDPYIIFFSNIFAILGLRSLFFLLVNIINTFHYLKAGLSILLTVIGLKMIFHIYLERIGFTTTHSLILVLVILVSSIILSLMFPQKKEV